MQKCFLALLIAALLIGTTCTQDIKQANTNGNSPLDIDAGNFPKTWEGSWPNGRYYSITIKKINLAKKVYGIYEWGSMIKSPSGSRKIKGEVRGGTFELFYGSVTLTLTPSDDGKTALVTWSKVVPNGIAPTIYSNAWKK